MKKILFLVMALCCTTVAKAQSTDEMSAILQHGDETTVFVGTTGFQQAYAAAVDGDVITLSQGTFQKVNIIEKALTILGAGFEDNAEAHTAVTAFDSYVSIGKSGGVIDGLHMEGIKINGTLYFDYETKNTNIRKCFINGEVRIKSHVEMMTLKQCRIGSSVYGENTNIVAKGLLLSNCYVNGNARNFNYGSSIHIDHCYIAQYGNSDKAQVLLTNSIVGGSTFSSACGVAPYSTMRNCIFFSGAGGFPATSAIGDYHKVDLATIFADATNVDYAETRTFELIDPSAYPGTDGTPIGLTGGAGWNKVPSRPYVKNLSATQSGTNLNVTYETGVK